MPADPNTALRNFDFAGVLGINIYLADTGADTTQACIYVGAITALEKTPAELLSVRVGIGSGNRHNFFAVKAKLRSTPPDYLGCADAGNATSCRTNDANGFALPGGSSGVDGFSVGWLRGCGQCCGLCSIRLGRQKSQPWSTAPSCLDLSPQVLGG